MNKIHSIIIVGLLAAVSITAVSIAEEIDSRRDDLRVQPIKEIPGCASELVYDIENHVVTAFKRERPCRNETGHESNIIPNNGFKIH